jgi:hypothetical protein
VTGALKEKALTGTNQSNSVMVEICVNITSTTDPEPTTMTAYAHRRLRISLIRARCIALLITVRLGPDGNNSARHW